ncbi:MAG: sugar transferase [Actinomycetota bacterium]|nr:sugar transferase [Actinomycetota bacterium]
MDRSFLIPEPHSRDERPSAFQPHPGGKRESWWGRYARTLFISDFLTLAWSFATAHIVWATNPVWRVRHQPFDAGWIVISCILLVVWHTALTVADTRDPRVLGVGPDEYKRVVNSTVFVFAFIAFIGYVVKFQIPRSYVLVTLPLGLCLLILSRWTWRQWLLLNRQKGRMSITAIAIGSEESVTHVIGILNHNLQTGYRIVGACVTGFAGHSHIGDVPVLDGIDDVASHVLASHASAVIVASSDLAHPDMVRRLGWDLEGHDIELIVAPALANIAGPRVHIRPVAGLPLLHVERPSYQGTQRWAKATFDRFGSVGLLIGASPLMLAIGLVIRLSGRGSVFFVQERVGRDGHSFGMIKFRSMRVGAENQLGELSGDAGNRVMFKLKDDPRITKVGRFIRRFSLDELPQLLNVVKGDMSLVGPRPPLTSEVAGYETDARRRLLVRPGITGPWQVSGRSDLNWEETVRLDLYYVENWSIVGDLLILWRTARAVLSSRGAY